MDRKNTQGEISPIYTQLDTMCSCTDRQGQIQKTRIHKHIYVHTLTHTLAHAHTHRSLVSVNMTLSSNTWLMAVGSALMWVVVGWSRKFLESAEEEVESKKENTLPSLSAFQYDTEMSYMNTDYDRDGLFTT